MIHHWRKEQPDAVMGSGPALASRCQRLATERLIAQITILRTAAGHPAAVRVHKAVLGVGPTTLSRRNFLSNNSRQTEG